MPHFVAEEAALLRPHGKAVTRLGPKSRSDSRAHPLPHFRGRTCAMRLLSSTTLSVCLQLFQNLQGVRRRLVLSEFLA